MMIKDVKDVIIWAISVVLLTIFTFGIALLAISYYTHTEEFYDSLNPDVLMPMHGYLWECHEDEIVDDLPATQICGWFKRVLKD